MDPAAVVLHTPELIKYVRAFCEDADGKCPPGTCKSCIQTWLQNERQLWEPEEETLVKWVRFGPGKDGGDRTAKGYECYHCNYVRIHDFVNISQDELLKCRRESETVNEKFQHSRFRRVNDVKFRCEKTDAKSLCLEEVKEQYREKQRTKTFYSLQDFCAKEFPGEKFKNLQERRVRVQAAFPTQKIVRDDAGTIGVWVWDLGPTSYRVTVGTRESVKRRGEVELAPDEIDTAFDEAQGQLVERDLQDGSDEDSDCEEESHRGSSTQQSVPQAPRQASASSRSTAGAARSNRSARGKSRSRSRSRGTTRSRMTGKRPRPSPAPADEDEDEDDPAAEEDGKNPPTQTTAASPAPSPNGKKTSKAQKALDDAHETFEAMKLKCSAQALWKGTIKSRDLTNALSVLSTRVHQLTKIRDGDCIYKQSVEGADCFLPGG